MALKIILDRPDGLLRREDGLKPALLGARLAGQLTPDGLLRREDGLKQGR